jgi:cob(I)alamin adenosyltransferase
MKIYTRTGHRGEPALFGAGRVAKDHARVEEYGKVVDLNAVLRVAVAELEAAGERFAEIAAGLRAVQADLFTVGARLATPGVEAGNRAAAHVPSLPEGRVAELERWIDAAETELAPLRHFVLPGGTVAAAQLHLARTVCRRAERRTVTLAHQEAVEEDVIVYLNRLSDLLFTLARLANVRAGVADVPWKSEV